MLDVKNGVPPPKPILVVTLQIPGYKRRRGTGSTTESSDAESDIGVEEVFPATQRQRSKDTYSGEQNALPAFQARERKRRSKRRHRSGPGSDFGVPGKSQHSYNLSPYLLRLG